MVLQYAFVPESSFTVPSVRRSGRPSKTDWLRSTVTRYACSAYDRRRPMYAPMVYLKYARCDRYNADTQSSPIGGWLLILALDMRHEEGAIDKSVLGLADKPRMDDAFSGQRNL